MTTLTVPTASGARSLAYGPWGGQRLRSTRETPVSLDVETEMVRGPLQVPRLALAAASDGRATVVVHPDRLGEFLLLHESSYFVGHNVQFDFWVVDRHLKQRGEGAAGRVLWRACNKDRLLDTQLLDLLLQLATGKFRHAPEAAGGEAKVYPGSLADVAADYTSLRVNKADPHRERFGELVGLGERDWAGVDPGFFAYAARDAFVTHRLYPALAEAAYRVMLEHGFDHRAERYDVRPDALEKFGYLSEFIQVRASVVLSYLFRRGVRVDLGAARALEAKYRAELAGVTAALERDYREVLTYSKDSTLQLTPKGRAPSLGTAKLVAMLVKVADQLRAQGHDVQVPQSDGKKQGVSRAPSEWARYAPLHPFLGLWASMEKLSKRLAFLAGFTAPLLHGEYSLLTRTGRTACAAPRSEELPGLNLQQTPREPEFRSLFIPDPGHRLFIGDYASAELRTLAAVCRAKFGFSKLGDVIARGVDPHAFTAAAVQGLSLEQFQALKASDTRRYKEGRQRSKPINFGVPGGMWAEALQEYALANYGVVLSLEEARRFRTQLITEVYPELNDRDGYLADGSMAALARNLGVAEREAWEAFDRKGGRSPLAARGVAKVVRGTSTASEHYQAGVWAGLCRLAKSGRGLAPEAAELIAGERGCRRLHELLYRQSAATLTGRLRAGVSYTESKNTPFQSLCADGAKLALWGLLYAGHDVCGFVHDEVLVQVPAEGAEGHAGAIRAIMVRAMEEVMAHGVPAECDYLVADCWTKP
jgi:hypothetical protein